MSSTFITKYNEFCDDLSQACPELATKIFAAKQLSPEAITVSFKAEILPFCSPSRDPSKKPEKVLPGVEMPPALWADLSENSRAAIQKHLSLLSFTLLMEGGLPADLSGNGWTTEWAEKMMADLKDKMKSVDFAGLSEKFAKLFGTGFDGKGGAFPQIPEKFLKGQIAKLAEEIVKEFRIEDLGFTKEQIEEANKDPSKALAMVSEVFSKNPQAFQKTIMGLTKKLQQKVQSGQLKPQELVAEAEELMKTFSENPQFVEMMESFRQAFGMEGHEDELRAAGRDGNARLSIVQQRLRAKLAAKKAGKGSK
jgi:hypothetical protein